MKHSREVPGYNCGNGESIFDAQKKYFPSGRVDASKRVIDFMVENGCIGTITVRKGETFQVFPPRGVA